MVKMIAVAEQRHLSHNNPDELIELIASEMRKHGLDSTKIRRNTFQLLSSHFMENLKKRRNVPAKPTGGQLISLCDRI